MPVTIRQVVFALLSVALLAGVPGCSKPDGQRELEAGLKELKRDNPVRAQALLERSIARRPGHVDNAVAHNALGLAAFKLGRYEDARRAFEDSRRLNPLLVEPVYNLGALAAAREDVRTAARFLHEAAAMRRDDPVALEYLAELYMQRGQWPEARNTLYAALDRDPRSPRIHNALAVVHTELGQAAEAMEALMLALETDTRYAPALFNLAVLYDTRLADGDQARAFYKRFLAVAPRDPRAEAARTALGRLEASGPLVAVPVPDTPRTPSAPSAGAPGTAPVSPADTLVVAAPVAPPPDPAVAALAGALAEAADLLKAGRVAQGLDRYEAAARMAAEAGRIEDEERALREAVRLAADQPRAHTMLARHLYRRGRYDEAGRVYAQAAALNAEYAPAQLGLGRMAVRETQYDAALFHYRKAIASDPSLADARWEIAQLMDINLKAPERAAQAYRDFAGAFAADPRRRAALERADELVPPPRPPPVAAAVPPRGAITPPPDPATARRLPFSPAEVRNPVAAMNAFNRAARYYEQQQWDQAIFFYLRALENDDQFVSAYYNLGLCYTAQGDNELARDAYRRAIRLQPDNLNAKYNLALLYREIRDDRSALRLLEEIVRTDPAYASAHQALGLMYAGREDGVEKAKQHYAEFLRLAPNDRSAPTIRQWIAAH